MTHRPADIPAEMWGKLLAGQFERLERAWLRLYCACVPKEARRRLLWTARWGPIGFVLFMTWGAILRALGGLERRKG